MKDFELMPSCSFVFNIFTLMDKKMHLKFSAVKPLLLLTLLMDCTKCACCIHSFFFLSQMCSYLIQNGCSLQEINWREDEAIPIT